MCQMSHVAYRLLLTPTTTATDSTPANFPIMHIRLLHNDQNTQKNILNPKITEATKLKNVLRYANISDTLFDQISSPREVRFLDVDWIGPEGQFSENGWVFWLLKFQD